MSLRELTVTELIGIIVALFGVLKVGEILLKKVSSKVENATADSIAVETALNLVQQYAAEGALKDERVQLLEQRVDKLEERERHMLTRAAVHEAWDQMAFNMLITHYPQHPPPPPLTPSEIEKGRGNE